MTLFNVLHGIILLQFHNKSNCVFTLVPCKKKFHFWVSKCISKGQNDSALPQRYLHFLVFNFSSKILHHPFALKVHLQSSLKMSKTFHFPCSIYKAVNESEIVYSDVVGQKTRYSAKLRKSNCAFVNYSREICT